MLALITVSVAHVRALGYLISSSCVHIIKILNVKELSLLKRSKEIKVYILSLGVISENFMGMEFYRPHIKPNIL